jgi:hypothetical protein
LLSQPLNTLPRGTASGGDFAEIEMVRFLSVPLVFKRAVDGFENLSKDGDYVGLRLCADGR